MGYYTSYKLSVSHNDSINYDVIMDYLLEVLHGFDPFEDSCKWYAHHHQDMIKVSLRFPSVVFILDGEGEAAGDIWRKCYLNGQIILDWKLPEINLPEPDENIIAAILEELNK